MKSIYRVLILLAAISLLLVPVNVPGALAQAESEPTGFKNVRLWIYPEYDDPRLLVMLEGQTMGVKAPAKVKFLVPSAAEMYSAGSMDAQGGYSGGPPNREPSSLTGWDEISYSVTTETFRVEYYDPIIKGQPDKKISYEFRWLYPISDLKVIIQEPRGSSNFSVSLRGDPFTDDQGFASHLYNYRDLDNEPPLRFEITYTKSDPNPSLAVKAKGSTGPLLIIGLVVGLTVFGVGLLWATKSRAKMRAERRYAVENRLARATSKGKSLPHGFCSQCGQPLESPSRFCPYCGNKLR